MRLTASLLLATIALATAAPGCASQTDSGEEDQPVVDENGEAITTRYDENELLQDVDLRGGQAITAAQVQRFLDQKGSYLARYSEHGRSAARIIVEESQGKRVNPVYMLARIQVESSLVQSGSSRNLSAATGCACPDGASCSSGDAGFGNQVRCAAKLVDAYFAEIDRDGVTRAGFGPGHSTRTLDPCTVRPANKATAVLYTYTPWVGAVGKQCGRRSAAGSSMVAHIYDGYRASFMAP